MQVRPAPAVGRPESAHGHGRGLAASESIAQVALDAGGARFVLRSNGEARELISRALVSLQAALEARELRVDRLTVDQPSQQSQDEPGWQGQRGQDGRQRGRDGQSDGAGFGARDGEAHEASSGTPPGRRVDAPAFGRHDGALNLVA